MLADQLLECRRIGIRCVLLQQVVFDGVYLRDRFCCRLRRECADAGTGQSHEDGLAHLLADFDAGGKRFQDMRCHCPPPCSMTTRMPLI